MGRDLHGRRSYKALLAIVIIVIEDTGMFETRRHPGQVCADLK